MLLSCTHTYSLFIKEIYDLIVLEAYMYNSISPLMDLMLVIQDKGALYTLMQLDNSQKDLRLVKAI